MALELESDIMRSIQLAYSRGDTRLMRNNVGVLYDKRGIPVTFGLGTGTSDLIGLKSVIITPDMVGRKLAVFIGIEVKTSTGRTTDAQDLFLDMLRTMGALHGVARTVDQAGEILARV